MVAQFATSTDDVPSGRSGLTILSTIDSLVQEGALERIEIPLEQGELEHRLIYGMPSFVKWLHEILPTLTSQSGSDLPPREQVFEVLHDYVTGAELWIGQDFKQLQPSEKGVWEFRTADTRIFGWFAKKDVFIATEANDATLIHQHSLHNGHRDMAVFLREKLDLDEPKFIPGGDPDDVISVRD